MKQLKGSRLLVMAMAGTIAASGLCTAAHAAPLRSATGATVSASVVSPVQAIKDDLNQQLLRALQDDVARRAFVDAMIQLGQGDLLTVLAGIGSAAGMEFSRYATDANQKVISLKGLDGIGGSILQAKLANPVTARQLTAGVPPLLAAVPDDAKTVKTFTAYGLDGTRTELDITTLPTVPVVLVGLDEDKVSPFGLQVLSTELNNLGFASELQVPGRETAPSVPWDGAKTAAVRNSGVVANAGGAAGGLSYQATKLNRIGLTDDEEPIGGAEVYGLILGQGSDNKGRTDVVDMQYLDYDHKWYYPGQQLINWSNFKWNSVDMLLMEQDDSTNYKGIAKAVVSSIGTAIGAAAYVPLINLVLSAFPDSWFTNDDDYVDSFYMLNKTQNGSFWGAAHNAMITVAPVTVTAS